MTVQVSRLNNAQTIIQFEGNKGQLITTDLSGLTLIRGNGDYKAFFGNGGRADLTEAEYKEIHKLICLSVTDKVASPATDDSDDDDDLTIS